MKLGNRSCFDMKKVLNPANSHYLKDKGEKKQFIRMSGLLSLGGLYYWKSRCRIKTREKD